jgi:hypothetical protein
LSVLYFDFGTLDQASSPRLGRFVYESNGLLYTAA